MSDLFGSLVGGGLALLGQHLTSQDALEAAQIQAQAARDSAAGAVEAGTPYTVASLGGVADFDPATKSALLTLSPELQDIYQGALTRSGLWGDQASEFMGDPFAAGELFYEKTQPYYQKEEDRLRSNLETRLLAQGRLGGTGGGMEQQALEESIGRRQEGRRQAGFNQAQALIAALLGREKGDLALATGLLNIPYQQANIGRGIGGSLGSIASAGLASQAGAEKLLAEVAGQPGLLSSALSGVGDYITRRSNPRPSPAINYMYGTH